MSEKKSNAGRPVFELPLKEFKDLCKLHCTLIEIAGWYDVEPETIERALKRQLNMNYQEAFKKYSAAGKISLRRAQWLQATDKMNISMLIWLGKQYLDQRDHVEHSGDQKAPIQLAYARPNKKQLQEKIEEKVSQEQEQLGEEVDESGS